METDAYRDFLKIKAEEVEIQNIAKKCRSLLMEFRQEGGEKKSVTQFPGWKWHNFGTYFKS